jgi:hypothetical protein
MEGYMSLLRTLNLGSQPRFPDLNKLFDGQINGQENLVLWDTAGTGTFTFDANTILMSVTANQYCVRQSTISGSYSSGSAQLVEFSMDNFHTQTGILKRVGAFTSSTVAPYTASLDGYWIENNAGVISMKSANAGTITTTKDLASWTGYAQISGYDWSKFRVGIIEYLWLGGARFRLWLVNNEGELILANDNSNLFNGVGNKTICLSPNKPVRYEIRSTGTNSGSFRAICSQISSASIKGNLVGLNKAYFAPNIAANTVNVTYALMGIRKLAGWTDSCTKIIDVSAIIGTADSGLLMLCYKPTLSAALTYVTTGKIQVATATTQTVTNTGEIVMIKPIGTNYSPITQNIFEDDQLTWLPVNIDGTFPELVLCYTPLTANQSVTAVTIARSFD